MLPDYKDFKALFLRLNYQIISQSVIKTKKY